MAYHICICSVDILHAEYDWEASHFSKVVANESHDQSLPLDHDDVIIKAMPVQQHNQQEQVHVCLCSSYTCMESCGLCLYLDQLLPKLNELKIKELWPSSPQQVQYLHEALIDFR